jgi:hypothetical protein
MTLTIPLLSGHQGSSLATIRLLFATRQVGRMSQLESKRRPKGTVLCVFAKLNCATSGAFAKAASSCPSTLFCSVRTMPASPPLLKRLRFSLGVRGWSVRSRIGTFLVVRRSRKAGSMLSLRSPISERMIRSLCLTGSSGRTRLDRYGGTMKVQRFRRKPTLRQGRCSLHSSTLE